MNGSRHLMPARDPAERIKNFEEVALGYTRDIAREEAARCLNCKNAPCMKGCPVGVRIPEFIAKVKADDLDAAAEILHADNNLPAICGRVCPQEKQCEGLCVRAKAGGAIAIGALERFVADFALSKKADASGAAQNSYKIKNDAQNDANVDFSGKKIKVAAIGSGPASLSCAADLARRGVQVTVYEALHKAGGVLVYGIPEFRLPKDIVFKEIEGLKALGVNMVTNVVVGKTLFIDELLEEYDAVFIGSGAGLPMFLGVEGENLCGVYSANEYLTRVNLMGAYKEGAVTPVLRGGKVVVVGAGNVAMDSARTARRLGAEVRLVYRRSRAEMPAREEEILHAEEEGVIFDLLVNPVKILGDENGFVRGLKLIKMRLGEPDASGRRSPVPIEDSEYDIEADEVIVALGTTPNPLIKNSMPSLEVGRKGVISVDGEGRTSIPRLYAGGDAATGAATVILAMGAGKRAAKAILEDLKVR